MKYWEPNNEEKLIHFSNLKNVLKSILIEQHYLDEDSFETHFTFFKFFKKFEKTNTITTAIPLQNQVNPLSSENRELKEKLKILDLTIKELSFRNDQLIKENKTLSKEMEEIHNLNNNETKFDLDSFFQNNCSPIGINDLYSSKRPNNQPSSTINNDFSSTNLNTGNNDFSSSFTNPNTENNNDFSSFTNPNTENNNDFSSEENNNSFVDLGISENDTEEFEQAKDNDSDEFDPEKVIKKQFCGNSKIKIVVDGNWKIPFSYVLFRNNCFAENYNKKRNILEDFMEIISQYKRNSFNIKHREIENDVFYFEFENINVSDKIKIYDDANKTTKIYTTQSKVYFVNPLLFLFLSVHVSFQTSKKVNVFQIPFFLNLFISTLFGSPNFEDKITTSRKFVYTFERNLKDRSKDNLAFQLIKANENRNSISRTGVHVSYFFACLKKQLNSEESRKAFVDILFRLPMLKKFLEEKKISINRKNNIEFMNYMCEYVQSSHTSNNDYKKLNSIFDRFYSIQIIPKFHRLDNYRKQIYNTIKNYSKIRFILKIVESDNQNQPSRERIEQVEIESSGLFVGENSQSSSQNG